MKIWDKGIDTDQRIEAFTVGEDRDWDRRLAPHDIRASQAHARMLAQTGLISEEEGQELDRALKDIDRELALTGYAVGKEYEDVHSQIEALLIQRLGDTGKKIHTARSRNDQVLTAMHLYLKESLGGIREQVRALFDSLIALAAEYEKDGLPGYTHLQLAMPSSFGLWFSSYAEQLIDDLVVLGAAYRLADQNPLGSAAGYGSAFPIDRELTTQLLGFGSTKINAASAQLSRGKVEAASAEGLASVADTLGRFCMDICLYSGGNFGFLRLPDRFTTGSSIMPHKKNPDVFELVRAQCNLILTVPAQIRSLTRNLPSGYHRDLQLSKGLVIRAFENLSDCLDMLLLCLPDLQIRKGILDDPIYDQVYSVDALNARVLDGTPFRDAYRELADEMATGAYRPVRELKHTHLGSTGNLGLEEIRSKLNALVNW